MRKERRSFLGGKEESIAESNLHSRIDQETSDLKIHK